MSARAPQDPHLRLGITELGLLDETSFLGPEVLPGAARLTVALWLCAESPVSTQVVASASNRSIEHDGWTGSKHNSAWFGGDNANYFNGSVGDPVRIHTS